MNISNGDKHNLMQWLKNNSSDSVGLEELDWSKPLKIKWGLDPTTPDLHIGHFSIMKRLRVLQDAGHIVYFVLGDYTARIGDPSGKKQTRPLLTAEQVAINATTYKEQALLILKEENTRFVCNNDWLSKLTLTDTLALCAQVKVGRLLSRDDFRNRLNSDKPFALHELLYPILVAYDSVELNSDIEVGGTDQWTNLMAGRHLLQSYGRNQSIVSFPLLPGLSGEDKMSKSLGNSLHRGVKEPYGKIMSIDDPKMERYFEALTIQCDLSNPMERKKYLAWSVTNLLYGKERADREQEAFIRRVVNKTMDDDDIEEVILPISVKSKLLRHILISLGLVSSGSAAYRLMVQGGIKVDGEIVGPSFILDTDEILCTIGKRRAIRIKKSTETTIVRSTI